MKYILIILIFVSSVFGISINKSVLKIHATLIPKIYLMDYNFKEKIKNNSINIAILYDMSDYKNAVLIKEQIETKYHNKIESYSIKVVLVSYSNIKNTDANIYYLLPTTTKNIKKTINIAKTNHALTFSYSSTDLKDGVMLSLKIDSKVKPIINLSAVKLNDITFRPILLKISHIYTKNQSNTMLYLYDVAIKDIIA